MNGNSFFQAIFAFNQKNNKGISKEGKPAVTVKNVPKPLLYQVRSGTQVD